MTIHMNEFGEELFDELYEEIGAVAERFHSKHPGHCSGCVMDGLSLAMLARLRAGGWTLDDIVRNATQVFEVEVSTELTAPDPNATVH